MSVLPTKSKEAIAKTAGRNRLPYSAKQKQQFCFATNTVADSLIVKKDASSRNKATPCDQPRVRPLDVHRESRSCADCLVRKSGHGFARSRYSSRHHQVRSASQGTASKDRSRRPKIERSFQRIVQDLEEVGFILQERVVRKNRCEVMLK